MRSGMARTRFVTRSRIEFGSGTEKQTSFCPHQIEQVDTLKQQPCQRKPSTPGSFEVSGLVLRFHAFGFLVLLLSPRGRPPNASCT